MKTGFTIVMDLRAREGAVDKLVSLVRSIRGLAVQHSGYEGGWTWLYADDPRRLVVMSHWLTRSMWQDFKRAPRTQEALSEVTGLLSDPEVEYHLVSLEDPA